MTRTQLLGTSSELYYVHFTNFVGVEKDHIIGHETCRKESIRNRIV